MDIRSISILVSRLSRPMVQRKNETKTKWQRHKYQILPSSSSFFFLFVDSMFSEGQEVVEKNLPRGWTRMRSSRDNCYYHNACYKWFGRFVLWLLCPVLNNTLARRARFESDDGEIRREKAPPFHPFSRAFKCLSSFQLRAAVLPDNRRVTRCPLSR